MSDIHFGTDGWRAIIGEDFNEDNVVRVVDAAAQVFAADNPAGTVIVGYDCRLDADKYAALTAEVLAGHGLQAKLSDSYCPTPTLCWTVDADPDAVGGIMLSSSHNPAEYLGIKLRMADGGASPKEFTDRVEDLICDTPSDLRGDYERVDIMTPYLEDLKTLVDGEAIRAAHLSVVYDPLFGAGRGYFTQVLRDLGVEVTEVHGQTDPTFQGLHPEPIHPWIDEGAATVVQLGADAGLITDGDADRIGAVDSAGNFVNPHRILALVVAHLVEDKRMSGRVVRTVSGSALIERQCKRLGLDLVTTPVGFKWIYDEMKKGDVLVGGEESGGIGVPFHVCERDGLLMALYLCELMAQKHKGLGELVADMFDELGTLEFDRRDLKVTPEQKERFLAAKDSYDFAEIAQIPVREIDRRDGVKFCLADDAWLLLRPSGTEPLVRVYAEAEDADTLNRILDAGCTIITG
ncbi:MAG: phosphoglucomutase/phosphomannomutase family protein [Coriobacteriaceae bacterium]|nr:phosphoglucomutase/phosphomannomutase family protein [Coriobacteriaceae bacterium]